MHQALVNPVVAIGIEVNAIRLDPAKPARLLLHRLVERQKGDVGLQAGLLQLSFVDADRCVVVPETVSERHRVFVDRREAQHHHLGLRRHGPDQLLHPEAVGISAEERATITASDLGAVVEPNRQQQSTRCLAAQFTAGLPLLLPTLGHIFQAISAHSSVHHGSFRGLHPAAP